MVFPARMIIKDNAQKFHAFYSFQIYIIYFQRKVLIVHTSSLPMIIVKLELEMFRVRRLSQNHLYTAVNSHGIFSTSAVHKHIGIVGVKYKIGPFGCITNIINENEKKKC